MGKVIPWWTEVAREWEEAVEEVEALCPWMEREDVERVRRVFLAQFGHRKENGRDLEMMAGELVVLAERAQEVGDHRRWVFEEWSRWAGVVPGGEVLSGPDLGAVMRALAS